MLTRAITGALFVAALIAGVYFNEIVAFGLFCLIVLLGTDEFYSLVKKSKTINPLRFWGLITNLTSIIMIGLVILNNLSTKILAIPLLMIFMSFIFELYRKKNHPFINIAYTILPVLYIAIPFAMLFHLGFYNSKDYSFQIILGFFFLLWTSDTGAYLSGRFFGKHKLFERISPKKTWEGTIGGTILTVGIAYVLSIYFTDLSLTNWIVIGILTAIFGGLGDLVESMLKRSLNIKDSGNILPGHGGILDRFDGLLVGIPFIYTYLQLVQ
ncbi:MAG: phosphatidate cytidylyltransferase [Vicingaceae bacterium]|nr:phosphatidate cytidylyltransferase [Vicingaceae bacterium]